MAACLRLHLQLQCPSSRPPPKILVSWRRPSLVSVKAKHPVVAVIQKSEAQEYHR